ncbi:hypothetical protein JOC26_001806 [Sporohalobacter salinus]|nr:hypothetical protein [Sporohalobacter salinus]
MKIIINILYDDPSTSGDETGHRNNNIYYENEQEVISFDIELNYKF